MNSTFIPASDLKDLPTVELESKFFQMSADVERLRQKGGKLPMAEASLQNVRAELARRRIRGPKP
jgi:hypothetical protein